MRTLLPAVILASILPLLAPAHARAQGGPPYYTTDSGTPGPNNRSINLG